MTAATAWHQGDCQQAAGFQSEMCVQEGIQDSISVREPSAHVQQLLEGPCSHVSCPPTDPRLECIGFSNITGPRQILAKLLLTTVRSPALKISRRAQDKRNTEKIKQSQNQGLHLKRKDESTRGETKRTAMTLCREGLHPIQPSAES